MIRPVRLLSPATLALSAAATLAIAVVGGAIVDRLWLALIPATGLLFLAIGALHARWGGDEGRLGVIGAAALRLACIALLATAIAGLVVVAVRGVEPAWLSAPAVVSGLTFMIGEILFGLAAAWRRTAPRGTAILFAIALPLGVAIDFLPRLLTPIPLFFSGAGMNIGLALLALAVARLGWAERRSTLSREDRLTASIVAPAAAR